MAADTAGKLRKGIVRSFLAIYRLGSNCNFQTVSPRFFDGSRPYYASSSGSASIASTKKTAVGAGLGWTSGAPETLIYLLTCATWRETERHAADPHPGFYTEVAHYLEAIQPAGSNDADTVVGHCAR